LKAIEPCLTLKFNKFPDHKGCRDRKPSKTYDRSFSDRFCRMVREKKQWINSVHCGALGRKSDSKHLLDRTAQRREYSGADKGRNEEFILASTFDERRDISPFFSKGNPLGLDEYCVGGHVFDTSEVLTVWQ
jgi:hypothetical protein